MISAEHAEEYTQALGQVVAGSWRHISLARKMGVPQALGLTLEEWVDERLGGYIKLSDAEFHKAVLELRKEGLNQRQIAQVVGVSRETVGLEERGERKQADKNLSAGPEEPRQQAESASSNGSADKNLSAEQPALIQEVEPMIGAAEAAIRELLRRFTREELLAALEAVK